MIIDTYLNSIQEGYVLSDKTISINLSEFQSGQKKNLLIVGVMGSGKTTIGEKLAKEYNIRRISIDSMWWRLRQKYFKNAPETDETERKLIEKVIEFVIDSLKSKERLIIEGVDLLNIYATKPEYRNLILNQSMIILGLSSLRAGIRAGQRNRKQEDSEGRPGFYWMTKFNIQHIEPSLKMLKNDIKKIPGVDIKEYSI